MRKGQHPKEIHPVSKMDVEEQRHTLGRDTVASAGNRGQQACVDTVGDEEGFGLGRKARGLYALKGISGA